MDTSEVGVHQAAFYYLKNNAPGTIPRAMLLQGACTQKAFNSLFCHCFLSQILRERWFCAERVCCRSLGLISGGSYCSSDSSAAAESFESNRAALTLQRCYLLGRACCFQRHPREEGLPGKTVSQALRGCSDLLYRTPRQGLPASAVSRFALPSPAPVTAEHWALPPA